MGIKEIIINNEKLHSDCREIKYLFCEKKGSDKLIITFPGFTDVGEFKYRYVRTLKDVNAHRLFILDNFGYRGCYLIGEKGDLSVETAVMSLINKLINKYNIRPENVILNGSSKGGWISLYYGIKYGFGHVIAGGPQTKIGDFLIHHEFDKTLLNVADYISGGHSPEDREYLNNLLYDLLYLSPKMPNINIHIGKGDSHYDKHVLPFINELDKINIGYNLDEKEYNIHTDVAIYYPDYLLDVLNKIDSKLLENYDPINEKVDLDQYIKTDDIKIHIERVIDFYDSTVSFKGWAFMYDSYCEDYERFLVIKTKEGFKKYRIDIQAREDVTKVFNDTKYLLCGFSCRVNRNLLKNKFKVGILFKSKKDNVGYYNEFNKKIRLNKL